MKNLNPMKKGVFYPIQDGWIMPTQDLPPGKSEVGIRYTPDSCMLEAFELKRHGERVGWYLFSPFHAENGGGYLVTFMEQRRGQAKEGTLVLRSEELLVFDLPPCGALACSTAASPEFQSILDEQ